MLFILIGGPALEFCQDEIFTKHLEKENVLASVIKQALSAATDVLFYPKCGFLRRWFIFIFVLADRNCQHEIGERQRLWMNYLCCSLCDARIVVDKVPLMACVIVNRATVDCDAAICDADSNEVYAADFSFNLCLHAYNLG